MLCIDIKKDRSNLECVQKRITRGSRNSEHIGIDVMRFGDFYFSKKQKRFVPLNAGGDWPKGNCNYPKLQQSYRRLAQVKKVTAFLSYEH